MNGSAKNVVYYVGQNVDVDSAVFPKDEVFLVYENPYGDGDLLGFTPDYGYFSFNMDLVEENLKKCTEISLDKYKELTKGYDTPDVFLKGDQELILEEKEKVFRELLVSEVLKDEYEYCFDKSYMSDEAWEKQNGDVSREQAYRRLLNDVSNKSTLELLHDYEDKYDFLYDEVRNINTQKVADRYDKFIIKDDKGKLMLSTTVDSLMENEFDYEDVKKSHRMKLLSDEERIEFLESQGINLITPTYESVREWDDTFRETGFTFYQNIKEVSVDEANKIIDTYDISPSNKHEGFFYCKDEDWFVGVDNSEDMCWTMEFKSFNHCMEWLGGAEYSSEEDLKWFEKEQKAMQELHSVESRNNIRKEYASSYIFTLDKDVQNGIRASLKDSIRKDGVYSSEEIDLLIEDGMHSRVSDLEDTIDVYGVIDNVLKERERYHESTLETLDSFYEDQLDYFKNQEKHFVDPRINALSSVANSHPDFAFNGDELDHETLKVWIKRKEERLFGSESTSELGSNNDLASSTKKLKDIGMER